MIHVVGVGRSGTTVVARVLQERLGVAMGGPGRTHRTNPTGDYEDRPIRAINRRLLRETVDRVTWTYEFQNEVVDREEPWGFKDPSSCHFLDGILEILPDAHLIWAYRDRMETAGSWARCYGQEPEDHLPEIDAREKAIGLHQKHAKSCLMLDFTERHDEDALARTLRTWLRVQGQEDV